eukprot:scaffold150571_cov35-Tisochrysis_lutea.AAC.1
MKTALQTSPIKCTVHSTKGTPEGSSQQRTALHFYDPLRTHYLHWNAREQEECRSIARKA